MFKKANFVRILSVFVLSFMILVVFAATIKAQTDGPATDPTDAPRSQVGEGTITLNLSGDSLLSCPATTVITNTFTGLTT